ncbi:CMP/dCMP deaminase, zinc-binding protein [Afipia carboxidovorans OM5]|uniref:CMP/dCMP deaminase, zinc-binding protein n=1 Tax=Afipia carboxidovorans (strain ATCC 49405 / DSM 1227 / KCTC 32145 / OM5) TaxID=504832 RepID=F8BW31_AFIC5|nr:nucleoside deaminase [Afipia carboxidovorans]AEI03165.1 CMP/dCMP deaminase, zinc-binding protein [Afipia carboxidovorans OM4]AEI06742.1 CMP/dCMP deaminase, zinc-binding protein [Afipia carboxidovorans OM5]
MSVDKSIDALFSSARVVHRRNFLAAGAGLAAATMVGNEAIAKPAKARAKSKITEQDRKHMALAIQTMRQAGIVDKTGGPFGAVVVRDGEVLAASGNSVLRDNDPSAHAEVNAIRIACKKIGAPNLRGATLFTSCECCPMCYATAYWARIDKIYYAAAWTDYADLFDDSNISIDMKKPYAQRTLHPQQMMQAEAQKVWLEFRKMPDRAKY